MFFAFLSPLPPPSRYYTSKNHDYIPFFLLLCFIFSFFCNEQFSSYLIRNILQYEEQILRVPEIKKNVDLPEYKR